jgi:hypothetical protein
MVENDIKETAQVHREAFSRQILSYEWITCNFKAFPKTKYFIAEVEEKIVGYIQWTEKSGFRKEVVLELEQIAVLPTRQGKGIGTSLIINSLPMIKVELASRGSTIKHILVTTRDDNSAKQLYINTLNAKTEAVLKNFFSADEVLMISRNFGKT